MDQGENKEIGSKTITSFFSGITKIGNFGPPINNKDMLLNPYETKRSLVRKKENNDFTPVIIKRNDQTHRHPDDILEIATLTGLEQHKRPFLSLFLSSLSAGLILGFAGMSVAVITQLEAISDEFYTQRLFTALVYPLGFIVSILSGTQLFTEHTATALYPVLDGRSKIKYLFSLWGIVLFGNLTGAFFSSILLYASDSIIMAKEGFLEISQVLYNTQPNKVFFGAILAGWLMAQGGWLIHATSSSSSQMLSIYIITFIIGFGGLPHSIAGASEIFSGILHSPDPNLFKSFRFIIFAILGNILGGTLFVGILNYAHIKKTQ